MKVVLLGAGGMLGCDLTRVLRQRGHCEICAYTRSEVDVVDPKAVAEVVKGAHTVINCAAYTAVDLAETEAVQAYKVNLHGAQNVAVCAHAAKARLMHTSTDYVFDGTKPSAYTERDFPNPINIYGASKLAGEKAVRAVGGDYVIVRLQALFGVNGGNFVEAILKQLASDNPVLKVVGDQTTIPSYTVHLSEAFADLLMIPYRGMLNMAASGHCSWHEFAVEIATLTGSTKPIEKVGSEAFPRPAQRPLHSVLDGQLLQETLHRNMPSWQDGLSAYLSEKGLL